MMSIVGIYNNVCNISRTVNLEIELLRRTSIQGNDFPVDPFSLFASQETDHTCDIHRVPIPDKRRGMRSHLS